MSLAVFLDGKLIDPSTLPGYIATGPNVSIAQAAAAGGQWTIRSDGLIENVAPGSAITHPAPWGLATVLDGRIVQHVGAVTAAHPNPSDADVAATAANPSGPVGFASPAALRQHMGWDVMYPPGQVSRVPDSAAWSSGITGVGGFSDLPEFVGPILSGMVPWLWDQNGNEISYNEAQLLHDKASGASTSSAISPNMASSYDPSSQWFGTSYSSPDGGVGAFDPVLATSVPGRVANLGEDQATALARATAAAKRLGRSVTGAPSSSSSSSSQPAATTPATGQAGSTMPAVNTQTAPPPASSSSSSSSSSPPPSSSPASTVPQPGQAFVQDNTPASSMPPVTSSSLPPAEAPAGSRSGIPWWGWALLAAGIGGAIYGGRR